MDSQRQLIHQVNNLLTVIRTQAAIYAESGDAEACRKALKLIDRCADDTEVVVVQARRALERSTTPDQGHSASSG